MDDLFKIYITGHSIFKDANLINQIVTYNCELREVTNIPLIYLEIVKLLNLEYVDEIDKTYDIFKLNNDILRYNDLSQLLELNISCLSITEIPSLIGLKRLKILKAEHNNIEIIKKFTFFDNLKIELIDLSFNKIKKLCRYSFTAHGTINNKGYVAPFYRLRELILNDNMIDDIHIKCFKYMPRLEYLNLKSNKLEYLFDYFDYLINLKSLDLSYNHIKIISNTVFNKLEKMHNLNLEHCRIKELDKSVFSGLDNLISLNLSNNYLNYLDHNIFKSLKNLAILNLMNCGIITKPYDTHCLLSYLSKLVILNIMNSGIRVIPYNDKLNPDLMFILDSNLKYCKCSKLLKINFCECKSEMDATNILLQKKNNLSNILKKELFISDRLFERSDLDHIIQDKLNFINISLLSIINYGINNSSDINYFDILKPYIDLKTIQYLDYYINSKTPYHLFLDKTIFYDENKNNISTIMYFGKYLNCVNIQIPIYLIYFYIVKFIHHELDDMQFKKSMLFSLFNKNIYFVKKESTYLELYKIIVCLNSVIPLNTKIIDFNVPNTILKLNYKNELVNF